MTDRSTLATRLTDEDVAVVFRALEFYQNTGAMPLRYNEHIDSARHLLQRLSLADPEEDVRPRGRRGHPDGCRCTPCTIDRRNEAHPPSQERAE